MKRFVRKTAYAAAMQMACLRAPKMRRRYKQVILKLDRLGDAILAMGAIRHLIRNVGEKDTLLIVSPVSQPLFEEEFPQVAQLVLPAFSQNFYPDFLSFLVKYAGSLRTVSTERLVCLRHQQSDYLRAICHLVAADECFAAEWPHDWEVTSLPRPAGPCVPYPENSAQCLELEAHRRVVEKAAGHAVSLADILPVMRTPQQEAAQPETLLICPKAGDALREYPAGLLSRAVALFLRQCPMRIVLCVPPGSDASPWQEALQKAGVHDIGIRIPATYQEFKTTVASATLILAAESAPAHLAAALDQRGVFWLGGGHHGLLAPWQRSSRQKWLTHQTDCYGCRWQCPYPDAHCITHIPPDAVAAALLEVRRCP